MVVPIGMELITDTYGLCQQHVEDKYTHTFKSTVRTASMSLSRNFLKHQQNKSVLESVLVSNIPSTTPAPQFLGRLDAFIRIIFILLRRFGCCVRSV